MPQDTLPQEQSGGLMRLASSRRARTAARFGVPALWASFVYLCAAVVANSFQLSLYLDIRGEGLLQYPVTVLPFPSAWLFALFTVAGTAVLVVQGALVRTGGVRGGASAASFVGILGGLLGFAFVDPRFSLLVAASFALGVCLGSRRATTLWDGGAREGAAWAALAVVAAAAGISLMAVLRWVLAGADGTLLLSNPSWDFVLSALSITDWLYPILPYVALLFLFGWAFRLLLPARLRLLSPGWAEGGRDTSKAVTWALLGTAAALALFVGVYPYLPAVNPASQLVGVDVAGSYSCWIRALPVSVCGVQGFTLENQRLGALWLLQGIGYLTSPGFALRAAPAIWGLFLSGSTYLFVREGTRDKLLAGVAAVLTAVSTEVVAGVNAGLLANWFGLSFAYLFFAALLRGLRERKRAYFAGAFGASMGLLFVHPWTWVLVLTVLITYLAAELLEAGYRHRLREKRYEAVALGTVLLLGFAVDAVRAFLPFGSGVVAAILAILPYLHLYNIPHVVPYLREEFILFLGGAEANPLVYLFGFIGVLAIPSLKSPFGKILAAWVLVVGVTTMLVGSPLDLMQARLVYDIPTQVYAAVGVVALMGTLKKRLSAGAGDLAAALVLVTAVCLMLGYALEYVGLVFH